MPSGTRLHPQAIVIVVSVAFIQEYRSDKSLEALNDLAPPHCRVIRNGGAVEDVLAGEVVPGDIVVINTGDRIPADVRLVEVCCALYANAPAPYVLFPVTAVRHQCTVGANKQAQGCVGDGVKS